MTAARHPRWESAFTPRCEAVASNGALCDLRPEHVDGHHGWIVQGGSRIEYHWPRWA